MTQYPLFKHQQTSINFIQGRERVFDASDPGTGKTRVAIESFNNRLVRGGGKALVLAPKSLLRSAWQADFKKFVPNIKTSVAYSTNRAAAFWDNADVYITNHDAAKWLAKQPKDFFDKFDTLIIDESGAFKNNKSQRSKAINKIKGYFTHRLALNGTPSPNTITELWNQINILDDGKRLGNSFYSFQSSVCTPKQVGPSINHIKWVDKEGANDAVTKLIEDITIRHKFEDCIDIPQNFEYSITYELSATQLRAYKQMEENQIALLNQDSTLVTAVNAASVATKLMQISSGAVYDENGSYHLVDTGRYQAICDLIEQRQHVIVFFLWKHQRDELIKEMDKRKITHCLIDGSVPIEKRTKYVDMFQKGMYKTCLAHPQSAAHGLTLTKGTSTIWSNPTYNLEHYQQGLRRIYRAGQTQKTETIVMVAKDTIEEKVWESLQNKKVKMDELLTQLVQNANAA